MMKKVIGLLALVLIMTFTSCSSDDTSINAASEACNLVDCATGNILIQFFDLETGEDVFFNGTYDLSNLSIIDLSTNEGFEFFTGTSEALETSQIALNPFFESRDNVQLRISVSNGFETDLSFDVEFAEGECCNINNYSNVDFTNVQSVENNEGELFYKVFL